MKKKMMKMMKMMMKMKMMKMKMMKKKEKYQNNDRAKPFDKWLFLHSNEPFDGWNSELGTCCS